MSVLRKVTTVGRLAARLDFRALRERMRINFNPLRVRYHRGKPFVHRDAGFSFVCVPDWPDSLDQFQNNRGDHWELDVLRRWLLPGDVAFDIGANLGMYAFAAADQVTVRGCVVAVDAAPFIVTQLETCRKLLRTPQVRVIHAAVTDTRGTVTFFISGTPGNTTEQSLHPSAEQQARSTTVDVPALTLRDLQREFTTAPMPGAIKLDIEGAEVAALSAAPPEWFGSDGPLWILEINPGALARFDATPAEVIAHFPRDRFDRWLLPKHPLTPAADMSLRRMGEASPDWNDSLYYNMFAIPLGPGRAARRARIRRCFP